MDKVSEKDQIKLMKAVGDAIIVTDYDIPVISHQTGVRDVYSKLKVLAKRGSLKSSTGGSCSEVEYFTLA
jgi:hypothetical protein